MTLKKKKKLIANEINKIFSLVVKIEVALNGIFNKIEDFIDNLLKFCVDNKINVVYNLKLTKQNNKEYYDSSLKELKYIRENIPRNARSALSIDLLKDKYESVQKIYLQINKSISDYNRSINTFNNVKERMAAKPNYAYNLYDHIKSSIYTEQFSAYDLFSLVSKINYFTQDIREGSYATESKNQNKKLIDIENGLLPLSKLVSRINKWQDLFKFITPTVFIELDDFKKEIEYYIVKIQNIKSFQELEDIKEHYAFLRGISENPNDSYYTHTIFDPIIEKSKSLSSDEKKVFDAITSDSDKIASENDLKKIVIEELFLKNKSKSFQPKELQTLKFMFKDTTVKDLFLLCTRTYSYKNDLQNFVKFITEMNFSKNELQQIFSKNMHQIIKIYENLNDISFTGRPYGYVRDSYLESDLKDIFYYLVTSNKSLDLLPDIFRDIHNFDENSTRIQTSVNVYNKLKRKQNQKASTAIIETRIQDLVYKNIQNNSKMLNVIVSNKNYNSFNTVQGKDLYKNYIDLRKYNFDINKLKSKFKITTEKIREILSTYTDEEYQTYLTTIKDIFDKNVKINVTDNKVKLLNSKVKTFMELLKNTTVYAKYNKIAEPKNEIFSRLSEEVEGFTFKSMPNKDFDMLNKIGVETNCCQFVGGAGSEAAIDSFINSMASVLVLEKDGNLISQSYFHYVPVESDPNGPGIILDNVETNDDNVNKFVKTSKYSLDLLYKLYAEKVSKRLGLKYVKCGEQYNKLTSSFFTKGMQDQDYRTFKTEDIYTDFDPENHLDIYNANNKEIENK